MMKGRNSLGDFVGGHKLPRKHAGSPLKRETTMKDPMQQDLLAAMERTKPRPRRQILSDELRARCRRIARLYGQGREPPADDEDAAEETEAGLADGSEADDVDR